jgi:lysozyme
MSWLSNLFKKKQPKEPDIIQQKIDEYKKTPIITQTQPTPVINKTIAIFPDISHYEPCNFSQFENGDMLTKATQGTSFVDSTLKTNMDACKLTNIRFGCYHFYETKCDPILQAQFYIKTVGLDNLKNFYYEPIVDYETTKGQSEEDLRKAIPDLKKFVQYVYEQTGRYPMFYSYESLIQYLELDNSFLNCRLWIARYGSEPTKYLPWTSYWAWQFSDGSIKSPKYNDNFKGIGRCDANIIK